MQEASEAFSSFFEGDHKGGTVKLFIGEIQEGDDAKMRSADMSHSGVGSNLPLSEVHMLGIFSINVQGLGFLGKIKDNAVEYSAQVWRGNRNALCVWHCTQCVPWKQRGKEVECCLGLICTNGGNPALRTLRLFKTKWRGDQTRTIGRFVHNFLRADGWWRWGDVETKRVGRTLFRGWRWRILDNRRTIGRSMRGR